MCCSYSYDTRNIVLCFRHRQVSRPWRGAAACATKTVRATGPWLHPVFVANNELAAVCPPTINKCMKIYISRVCIWVECGCVYISIYIYRCILKMSIIIVWRNSSSSHNYPCVVRIPMVLAISPFALDTGRCHARGAAQWRALSRLCTQHQEEVQICATRRRVCTDV